MIGTDAREGAQAPGQDTGVSPDGSTDEPQPVPFRRLYGLARPHLPLLLSATALLLLMSLAGLAVPKLAGDVLDTALERTTRAELWNVVKGMVVLFAFIGLVGFGEAYLLGLAGARLLRDLRESLFAHLVRLSPGFYDRRRVGELLSRLGSDLEVVEASITQSIPFGIQALLRFVGTLIVLFVLHTKLTLIALAVVPPVVVIALFIGQRVEKLATAERDAAAEMSALGEELLAGIRTVQATGSEDRSRTRFNGLLATLLDVQVKNTRIKAAFAGLVTFAGFTSFALVLGYGGDLMFDRTLTAGELTAFLLYTFSIAMSVGQLASLWTSYKELGGACTRLFQILDEAPEVDDPAERVPAVPSMPVITGRVKLEGVRFRYEGGEADALNGVSFTIEPRSMVALVGPSGSGKSTILSLLLRFYDITGGSFEIDGRSIDTIPLEDLRRAIGVVPQEVFLFSGTVKSNLRLGAPDASDDDLWAALESASATEFVRALPKGLDTEIGERGTRLSGGQRQRLAIARAFLEDPAILALDEATSSLDPDSEAKVQEALGRLFEGRTTLVIAHRLATARKASIIHVLDGGSITASGTHDELIASSELYRRYWELQSLETTSLNPSRNPGS